MSNNPDVHPQGLVKYIMVNLHNRRQKSREVLKRKSNSSLHIDMGRGHNILLGNAEQYDEKLIKVKELMHLYKFAYAYKFLKIDIHQ